MDGEEAMNLSRYDRQMRVGGLGSQGQQALGSAKVAIVGVGATGGAVAALLARAGVGELVLIDRDIVELHNLQRQLLFSEADAAAGRPKAVAAAEALRAANSAITITPLVLDLHAETIEAALGSAQLVIDGSDNFETRYLINEYCVREGRPWIYCGVLAAYGMTITLRPGGPCFRCLFPQQPAPGAAPTCDTAGVLGGAVAAIGGIAATEALKLLSGRGSPNPGIISLELWEPALDLIAISTPRPDCETCGQRRFPLLEGELSSRTAVLCGRDTVQVRPAGRERIDLRALAQQLAPAVPALTSSEHLLRFTADGHELTVFADGRALIKGTEDETLARSLYARWIGM